MYGTLSSLADQQYFLRFHKDLLMRKLLSSPLSLSANPSGYSIVDSTDLTSVASRLVLLHISEATNQKFDSLESAAEAIILNNFSKFKDKPARIFPKHIAEEFLRHLEQHGYLTTMGGDFVTDEEGLGYENIYWRLVRKNSSSDVGPVHADRWFWELGESPFPNSHARVKVWMPLIQDDANPSLKILPGSQNNSYAYGFVTDPFGKKKPSFQNIEIEQAMISAPIKIGEAIIFNDSLLHGGTATVRNRVSIEFTIAQRKV
jgi:hypothetical protein